MLTGQNFAAEASGQYLFNDLEGDLMIPPGFGGGVTLSMTSDSELIAVPVFEFDYSLFDFGRFAGGSIGFTVGANPVTGGYSLMDIHGTLGLGFAPGPVSLTFPTIYIGSAP